jgi:hypothetical protein
MRAREGALGWLGATVGFGVLCLPGPAGAQTKTVYAGPPPSIKQVDRRYLPSTFTKIYRTPRADATLPEEPPFLA